MWFLLKPDNQVLLSGREINCIPTDDFPEANAVYKSTGKKSGLFDYFDGEKWNWRFCDILYVYHIQYAI